MVPANIRVVTPISDPKVVDSNAKLAPMELIPLENII